MSAGKKIKAADAWHSNKGNKKTMRRDNPWQIKEGKIKVVQRMIDW